MKRLVIITLLCVTVNTATAQDDDKGFITNFLQDNLSGAGRIVEIDGFEGALSSRARMERLSIADDAGVWFILEDVVLDWNRLALLSGNLNVNSLTARSIQLLRLPETTTAAPAPESSVFQLPTLPISVSIAELKADQIILAKAVLGEEITASLDGALEIIDGAGSSDLDLIRIDDKRGELTLHAAFSNDTNILDIDLSLQEQSGGILADALALPGSPSLDFQLNGSDPLSDFNANIRLATNGEPRLSGTIEISDSVEDEDVQQFNASVGGDISPLFLPAYQPFFGENTQLFLDGSRNRNGGLNINELSLKTAALDLAGSLVLADGLPEQFNITGSLHSPDDIIALLPLPGAPVNLRSAKIEAKFLASDHNRWTLNANFADLGKGNFNIRSGTMVASGVIDHIDTGKRSITADIQTNLTGVEVSDPALAKAIGSDASASTKINWQDGEPISIQDIVLSALGIDITGDATISDMQTNLRVTADAIVKADDLTRFSDLLGLPASGMANVKITGWYEPLGGAFDATVNGHSTDLAVGPDPLPALLKGNGTIDIALQRNLAGVHLQTLNIGTDALKINASGDLQTDASKLDFKAQLSDIALLAEGFSGPATLSGHISKDGAPWTVDTTFIGPAGSKLDLNGTIEPDPGTADLQIIGNFPLGLADQFLPQNISVDGTGNIDMVLNGPFAVQSLNGEVSINGATVSLPVYNVSLADVNTTASLSDGNLNISASTNVTEGGKITVSGVIDLTDPYATNLDVVIDQFAYQDEPFVRSELNGQINLSGALASQLSLSGDINLLETNLQLGSLSGGGKIPVITHTNEPEKVRLTRQRAGLDETQKDTRSSGPGIQLDVVIHAPGRIFLRGAGLNAEMKGDLRVTGSTNDIVPVGQFNLVRGRLDILGRRLDLIEGTLYLQGAFAPYFRVIAETKTQNATVRVTVQGNPDNPDIIFSSDPEMPEEEVLAEMLFGKSLSEMSSVEAATLAARVARLAGGGGNRIADRMRENLGLDDFGVTTSEDGNLALKAGKYLSDNVYADVVVDSEGHSQVDLNMDITSDFTLRGSTDNQGNTGIGIFFEHDY